MVSVHGCWRCVAAVNSVSLGLPCPTSLSPPQARTQARTHTAHAYTHTHTHTHNTTHESSSWWPCSSSVVRELSLDHDCGTDSRPTIHCPGLCSSQISDSCSSCGGQQRDMAMLCAGRLHAEKGGGGGGRGDERE